MFFAKSTCFGVRLPTVFSASCWPRIRIELSGVRNSCDMLARNSVLYFEVSASSAACSSGGGRPHLVLVFGWVVRRVLRGARELGSLLFECAPRLLDFLVLPLDFDVLL